MHTRGTPLPRRHGSGRQAPGQLHPAYLDRSGVQVKSCPHILWSVAPQLLRPKLRGKEMQNGNEIRKKKITKGKEMEEQEQTRAGLSCLPLSLTEFSLSPQTREDFPSSHILACLIVQAISEYLLCSGTVLLPERNQEQQSWPASSTRPWLPGEGHGTSGPSPPGSAPARSSFPGLSSCPCLSLFPPKLFFVPL